jgi:hypothetical protein
VLGLEVEDIDSKSNVVKEGIFVVSDHAGKLAVVIKEDMVRLDVFMECTLNHLLFQGE